MMTKTLKDEVLDHLAHLTEQNKSVKFFGVEMFYSKFHHHGPDAIMYALLALREEGRLAAAGSHFSPDAVSLIGKVSDIEDD